MKMSEIRDKARQVGINPDDMKKTELIRAIQSAENFSPCYGTGVVDCPYIDCCFKNECVELRAGIPPLQL